MEVDDEQAPNQEMNEHEDRLAMLYCPVCGERLVGHRCKLICQQCGYFMSCADYY